MKAVAFEMQADQEGPCLRGTAQNMAERDLRNPLRTALLPEEIERNLHYIEIFTQKKIRNILVGNYTSVVKGHGYDFVDHKKYQAGDDIRKIDWNAMARTGYPLIKNTHEEKELEVFIAADLSRSMELASGTLSKKEVLLYITAALGYSATSDRIRVGFVGFTDRVEIEMLPRKRRSHLFSMLQRLWDFKPQGSSTRVVSAFEALQQRLSKMSVIFLISDFLFEEDLFERTVFKQIIARHDLIPIVLNDPLEARLPAGHGHVRLRDLESGKKRLIRLSPRSRALYEQANQNRRRELINNFYRYRLDFQEIQTDCSFHELISGLFLMRKRR